MVIPTIDDELTLFANARNRFLAAGVCVMVSPPETTVVCNDKLATCRELRRLGIAAAESYLPADLPASPVFPLFIKPRYGRGSVGAFPIRNARELAFFLDYVPDPVVQPDTIAVRQPLKDDQRACDHLIAIVKNGVAHRLDSIGCDLTDRRPGE